MKTCYRLKQPLENPTERTTQETPTAAAVPIPFIETLEDLPISAINSVPGSEIPEDAVPSEEIRVDTLPSTKTLQIHPIPVTDNFPIQENLSVPTSDENPASPVSIHLPSNDIRTVRILAEAMTSSIQIFLICNSGEEMAHESAQLAKTAYEVNFVGTDVRIQKCFVIILRKAQTPCQIRAGKLIDVSLITFAGV
ncbi:hypothetical protein RN001_011343 [Aquatica leii]|uniref:Uncharacterized protein n=1 Tax=Aquatica leii TaxID=1421715 RepID=A0AAN7SEY8_9COLE|nr:hypothetical protein RN001_011343 [Aquatica leii]